MASSPARYALPSQTADFPYGLRGTSVDSAQLIGALGRDFVLLLGDRDMEDRVREPEAMRQGRNRFARGLRFFAMATEIANEVSAPLEWAGNRARGRSQSRADGACRSAGTAPLRRAEPRYGADQTGLIARRPSR